MSKYNFEKEGNKIIAVSSYAGRPVKGYAKCHPDDKFDEASGRALAKARCNQKVAYKRNKRAFRKLKEAREALAEEVEALKAVDNATQAELDAYKEVVTAAIAAGVKKGEFKEVNVMVSSGEIGTPCFVCRQMILELFDKECIVRCWALDGRYKEFN